MNSKFKLHSKLGIGLYKFKGDISLNELLDLLTESYSYPEFKNLSYTILDFRECTFAFEAQDIKKIVQLVEKNKETTGKIKSTLIVNDIKVTALTSLFQHDLKIGKQIVINSTMLQTLNFFKLSVSVDELEKLFSEML